MDLLALRTFVTVRELQSFSRASEQLYLTQPAVSKRIAALELELGCQLFDRIGKKVLLTDAGKELYRRSHKILLDIEDCRRALSTHGQGMCGKLSFATSHHIGLHRLPPILQRFSKNYPEVELDIRFMGSEQAYRAVVAGEVEFALVTLQEDNVSGVRQCPLWRDPLQVVVADFHPLCQMESTGNPATMMQTVVEYPAILPEKGTHTRQVITMAFEELGSHIKEKVATNYLETIKMLVSVGLGWGVLPQIMVNEGELCTLSSMGINLERHLGIISHEHRTLSKNGITMWAELEESANVTVS